MDYELSEIKKMRKSLGLTQTQLARQAQVSQSLLAKIEAGAIDPTFGKAKRLFQTLQDISSKQAIKAADLMNSKLVTMAPGDDIKASIKKMKKYEISQMPVVDKQQAVGIISESILLEALLDEKGKIVSDIMQDAPPVVSSTASIQIVSNLLTHYPMVIVSDSGKMKGIITKSDLLGKLYSR